MTKTATSAALPPGTMGLPFLGEALAFGKNPFRFLEDRQKRYGNICFALVPGAAQHFLVVRC
jgi:hypothetical protein